MMMMIMMTMMMIYNELNGFWDFN